jgi:hypothetical protein
MKKIGTTLFCAALAALTYAGGTAHSLTVGEGFVDPLGFHDSTPTFSWKLPVGVEQQTAYQIEVRGACSTMRCAMPSIPSICTRKAALNPSR